MNLAYIPSPPQGVWFIGPFPVRAYALCILVGILLACWWGTQRWIARGGRREDVVDIALVAVPFGLIGGRLYHVATDWQTYFGGKGRSPIHALYIWEGGLGIWGAIALGAVGAWIGCRKKGIPLTAFGDALAPPVLAASAIGRFGNYFNQELFGRETNHGWGLRLYERVRNGSLDNVYGVSDGHPWVGNIGDLTLTGKLVHPTFLYEACWNLAVVVFLVILDRQVKIGHGRLFSLYVAFYSLGRLGLEFVRVDPATHVGGLRINVYTSSVLIIAGIVYFLVATKGRENPDEIEAQRLPAKSTSPTQQNEDSPPDDAENEVSLPAGSNKSTSDIHSTEAGMKDSED